MSAHFEDIHSVDMSAMLKFVAEHLSAWQRRLQLLEDGPVINLCGLLD